MPVIGVLKETAARETRVAMVPHSAGQLVKEKHAVLVQAGAGLAAGFADADYQKAGAKVVASADAVIKGADLLMKVQPPSPAEVKKLRPGTTLVSFLSPATNAKLIRDIAARNVTAYAMEYIPRISRAQAMDALSAMSTSTTNLRMVGNVQARAEALDATIQAQEKVISVTQFVDTPTNAIPNPCGGMNTLCPDLNGDGTPDLTVVLTPAPQCVQAREVKVSELKIDSPTAEDVACLQGQQQGQFAVAGAAPTGNSLCGQTVWDITAQAMNAGASTTTADVKVTSVLGIGVRIPAVSVASACPP